MGGICGGVGGAVLCNMVCSEGLAPSARCYCCCKAARTAYMLHLRTCREFAGDAYAVHCSVAAAAVFFAGGHPPLQSRMKARVKQNLPALSAGSARMLTLAYTRVFKTSCSGTGRQWGAGYPRPTGWPSSGTWKRRCRSRCTWYSRWRPHCPSGRWPHSGSCAHRGRRRCSRPCRSC